MKPIQSTSENTEEKMTTVMADDLQIKGTMTFKTSLMIKGSLEGEIISEGMLVVGPTANVNAAITTKSLVSQGTIEGDVVAGEKVVLKNTSKHTGKITTPVIVVESGSLFNGSCVMTRKQAEEPQKEKSAVAEEISEAPPIQEPIAETPQAETIVTEEQSAETSEEDKASDSSESKAGQFGFSWKGNSGGNKGFWSKEE